MKRSLDIIKKTIKILNSVSYENYSDGKERNYLNYIIGSRRDEDKLISPILFRKFLEQILGFELGRTIATQELKVTGKPDYTPVDTRTHPFVFDAKGTDTQHLSQHLPQIKKYLKPQEIQYGVLTNMRDLEVYVKVRTDKVEDYNFSFIELYKDYKNNIKFIFEEENTKRFLNFIERFKFQELTSKDKIKLISEDKPFQVFGELNIEILTNLLRLIVKIFYEDIKNRKEELAQFVESDPERVRKIAQEIELITTEISKEREMQDATSELFIKILEAQETSVYGRALNTFFYRIAYFTMTRLLLTRTWEDIGFIDQSLYDGGFKKWYTNFNYEIKRVLRTAFGFAAERYPWLFNVDNNYSWYEPSDNALIESLYELSNFNLIGLNQDVLGSIYEEYIDKVDKKNKGQYYTPREIVSFIWDRVGYTNPKAFFWQFEGKRVPRFIFDPATGSGGFLVEAARRLREEPGIDFNEFQDLFEIYRGILFHFFGAEISIFPYYITEVNLLIQLTPILKRMMGIKKAFREPTPIGVVRVNALSLYNFKDVLFKEDSDTILKEKTINILPLDSPKKAVFNKIREKFDGKFSYCCANPPYVGEKGHKELFRETLRSLPSWREYYQGKMDYLYWFIILGLSKLREYGKLGFITTSYWSTADGASKLRKYILENSKIKEMILFEDVKIFEHAKGQHNMVFVLTKCSGEEHKKERENNHIKIVQVKCKNHDLYGKTIRENLRFLTDHIQRHITKTRYEDEYIKVFWSGVKQAELTGGAWNLMQSKKEKQILSRIESNTSPIIELYDIDCGIFSNADFLSKKYTNLIPENKRSELSIQEGDGIFILSAKEVEQLFEDDPKRVIIKRTYKNSDIDKYFIDKEKDIKYLLYIDDDFDPKKCPRIIKHLEKFKEVLSARLERYGEKYTWWRLHRPHIKSIYENPKIVTSRWGKQNFYAIQESNFFENSDINLFIPRNTTSESSEYILALLNSKLMNYWIEYKGRGQGVSRQIRLKKIPIKRINFNESEKVKIHDELVEKVQVIQERISELYNHSKFFIGIRLTRVKFDSPLPQINVDTIIKNINGENIYNLRTHPEIRLEKSKGFNEHKFYLSRVGKPELTLFNKSQLNIYSKNRSSVFITGPHELLELLANILINWKNKSFEEVKENILIPDTIQNFNLHKMKILNKVQSIRKDVLSLQEEIDNIVYKLYGLTEEDII